MLDSQQGARMPHARTVRGNPLSFFAISNLYTISESRRNSRDPNLDHISVEAQSGSEGITALPQWEHVQSPKRALTRHGSRDLMLEKGVYGAETEVGFDGARSGASTPEDEEISRPSRMAIWLILVVIIVLALAVILGAVLGTFVSPGSKSPPGASVTNASGGTAPTSTPAPTPTGGGGSQDPQRPSWPARIESLAVTGWSTPGRSGYFTTWLFSQDDDGSLSRHTFNSSTGNWSRVSNFAFAKPRTPLAATTINTQYYSGKSNYNFPQAQYVVSVVYLDSNNHLNEWIFADSGPDLGQRGSLTQQKYIVYEETDISFYWPLLVYQGVSGEIREAHFECHRKNECWHDNVLPTTKPSNGTRLETVPMRNNLSSTGLFYQEESGRYVNYKEDHGEGIMVWGNEAFSNLIPNNATLSAFSTTRPDSPISLSTYLLWQNEHGIAQMSWSDTDKGWQGPVTHAAFSGANNNTALACLTGPTFPGFPLSKGTEMSRCYFQAGAAVREVGFNGASWDVVGNVGTFGF